MRCPKCQTDSCVASQVQEINVDRCETCGGIWFDEQELVLLLNENLPLLASLRGGADPEELNSKRGRCPRDSTPLLRVYSSFSRSVVVDTCPHCHGMWLDGGEFDELLRAINRL